MNPTQVSAFTAAANVTPSTLGSTAIAMTAAVGVLWTAQVIRKMGLKTLEDGTPAARKRFLFYKLRAIVLLMVLIFFLTP